MAAKSGGDEKLSMGFYASKGAAKRRGNVAVPAAERRWCREVGGGSNGGGRPINMAAGEGVAKARKGSFKWGAPWCEAQVYSVHHDSITFVTLSFFHPFQRKGG